jgi:hypothetical protein
MFTDGWVPKPGIQPAISQTTLKGWLVFRILSVSLGILFLFVQPEASAEGSLNTQQVTDMMVAACVPAVDVHLENAITNPTIDPAVLRTITTPRMVVATTNVEAVENFARTQGWTDLLIQQVPGLKVAQRLEKVSAPRRATGLLYQASKNRLVVRHKTYLAESPIYQTASIILSQWDGHVWKPLGKTVANAFKKSRCSTVWWDSYSVVGRSDDSPIYSDGSNADGPWYPLSLPKLPHGYYRIAIEGSHTAAITIHL